MISDSPDRFESSAQQRAKQGKSASERMLYLFSSKLLLFSHSLLCRFFISKAVLTATMLL